jgi:hypothetical protein
MPDAGMPRDCRAADEIALARLTSITRSASKYRGGQRGAAGQRIAGIGMRVESPAPMSSS